MFIISSFIKLWRVCGDFTTLSVSPHVCVCVMYVCAREGSYQGGSVNVVKTRPSETKTKTTHPETKTERSKTKTSNFRDQDQDQDQRLLNWH